MKEKIRIWKIKIYNPFYIDPKLPECEKDARMCLNALYILLFGSMYAYLLIGFISIFFK